MLNRVTLLGRLGSNPELRYLASGIAVARCRLATHERYRNAAGAWTEHTEWHSLVFWRKLAERAEQQLQSGMQVFVEGKLRHREYTDAAGKSHRVAEVEVDLLRKTGGADTGRFERSTGDDQQSERTAAFQKKSTAEPGIKLHPEHTGRRPPVPEHPPRVHRSYNRGDADKSDATTGDANTGDANF